MLFNSFIFVVFFTVFLVLYRQLAARVSLQNILILVASCIFYGAWDWRFLGLLWFTITVDYLVARQLDIENDARRRRLLLYVSLASNLGLLGFFKYFDFFADSLNNLLIAVGLPSSLPVLHLVLPVGISFYTLHTLGYVLDVYYRRERAVHSPIEFACFVAFFPLLVAGPIVRIGHMRHQFSEPRRIESGAIATGIALVVIGLFQKVVIADNLAVVVEHCFADPGKHGAADLLVGIYAFAFQIYGDFAGYSNIAIGISAILGFSLAPNFDRPYFSAGFRDFWRRWHISLSSWLRDYVYIPLGGSRTGKTYRNLILTMGLCGLWHGANWSMVLWGVYHGMLLSVQRLLAPLLPDRAMTWLATSRTGRLLSVVVTFHLICLGWLVFRAPTLADAWRYATGILDTSSSWTLNATSFYAFFFIGLAVSIDVLHRLNGRPDFFVRWPVAAAGAVCGVLFVLLQVVGGFRNFPFIYFQF